MAKKRWICHYCRKMNPVKKRKCQYCGEWKVLSKPKLKKKLDRVFSKYIRKRDRYRCVTCGRTGNEAGHYVKRSVMSLRYDKRNVNTQCSRCNKYLGGNMDEYAVFLQRKYGKGILEELNEKKQEIFKPSKQWFLDKIEEFKQKLEEVE